MQEGSMPQENDRFHPNVIVQYKRNESDTVAACT
jgi:hypothetical protein